MPRPRGGVAGEPRQGQAQPRVAPTRALGKPHGVSRVRCRMSRAKSAQSLNDSVQTRRRDGGCYVVRIFCPNLVRGAQTGSSRMFHRIAVSGTVRNQHISDVGPRSP